MSEMINSFAMARLQYVALLVLNRLVPKALCEAPTPVPSPTAKCMLTITLSRTYGSNWSMEVVGNLGDTFMASGCSEMGCDPTGNCASQCIAEGHSEGIQPIQNQLGETVGYGNCCNETNVVVGVSECKQVVYTYGGSNTNECPVGWTELEDVSMCQSAALSLGVEFKKVESVDDHAKGCYAFRSSDKQKKAKASMLFNTHATGSPHFKNYPVCMQAASLTTEAPPDVSSTTMTTAISAPETPSPTAAVAEEAACSTTSDCPSGLVCVGGYCQATIVRVFSGTCEAQGYKTVRSLRECQLAGMMLSRQNQDAGRKWTEGRPCGCTYASDSDSDSGVEIQHLNYKKPQNETNCGACGAAIGDMRFHCICIFAKATSSPTEVPTDVLSTTAASLGIAEAEVEPEPDETGHLTTTVLLLGSAIDESDSSNSIIVLILAAVLAIVLLCVGLYICYKIKKRMNHAKLLAHQSSLESTSNRQSRITEEENIHAPWDFFLSHTQRNQKAVSLALDIYYSMLSKGYKVWLDVKMEDRSSAGMEHGVRNSQVVLAIITGSTDVQNDSPAVSYFSRPLCCQELRWALQFGIPVQPVINFSDKPYISELIDEAPPDLKFIADVDFIDVNRSDPEYFQVGMQKLKRVLARIERTGASERLFAANSSSTTTVTTTVTTTSTSVGPVCVGQPHDAQSVANNNVHIARAEQSTACCDSFSSISAWAAAHAETDENATADGSEMYLRYDVEHTIMAL